MSIGVNNFRARIVRNKAAALIPKRIVSGGAHIRDGDVLGLRFKPAPVFHFLGAGKRNGNVRRKGLNTCLKQAKSEQAAVLWDGLSWGVMFGE